MLTHHDCNGGSFDHEIVNVYIFVTYFGMISRLMTFFEAKNCILIYTETVSETSDPKEDYILYNQKYIDHVLHVMMIEVGKLRTKRQLICILIALIYSQVRLTCP